MIPACVKDLIGAIETFIDSWNAYCQPFVWTKTADKIDHYKAGPRPLYATLACAFHVIMVGPAGRGTEGDISGRTLGVGSTMTGSVGPRRRFLARGGRNGDRGRVSSASECEALRV